MIQQVNRSQAAVLRNWSTIKAPHFFVPLVILIVSLFIGPTFGQVGQQAGLDSAEPVGVFAPKGVLCLVGGGSIPSDVRKVFAEAGQAGQAGSRLIIIPTASAAADLESPEAWTQPWAEYGFGTIEVLHTSDREQADTLPFADRLSQATAIWISGGDQSRLSTIYAGTAVEKKIIEMLSAGCAVGGTSAGAAIASKVMIAGGKEEPKIGRGFDLLPWSVVDQHFSQRSRGGRLQLAVQRNAERVGLGIDESTAVFFQGRSMAVVGNGQAYLYFAKTAHADSKQQVLKTGQSELDWTTLARTAKERQRSPFPNEKPVTPTVESGALLIVGGGGATSEIWRTFFDLAGGKQANIVVLPTAMPSPGLQSSEASLLRRMGAKNVSVLNATDRKTISSEEFLDKLRNATGIWFGGGRQWRFVDVYEGTGAVEAMHQCLQHGGIIGGSSAGASIQGDLLIRGAATGNQIMVQDGYRRGFGFLPGVGIDQHFSQRDRFADLESTIKRFPSILGIGIDEATGILVQKQTAKVIGKGSVYLYNWEKFSALAPDTSIQERPVRVKSGEAVNLQSLEVIRD